MIEEPPIQSNLVKKPKPTKPKEPPAQSLIAPEPSKFATLDSGKLRIVDMYQDARTFFQAANSTKFVVTAFGLLTIPLLLMFGFISPDIYKDMTIILTLTYLGADVFEKQALIKSRRKPL